MARTREATTNDVIILLLLFTIIIVVVVVEIELCGFHECGLYELGRFVKEWLGRGRRRRMIIIISQIIISIIIVAGIDSGHGNGSRQSGRRGRPCSSIIIIVVVVVVADVGTGTVVLSLGCCCCTLRSEAKHGPCWCPPKYKRRHGSLVYDSCSGAKTRGAHLLHQFFFCLSQWSGCVGWLWRQLIVIIFFVVVVVVVFGGEWPRRYKSVVRPKREDRWTS